MSSGGSHCDACLLMTGVQPQKLHGRFFGGRQLECFYWDNKTNYKVKESEEQTQARLKEFGDWLETGKE